MKYTALSRKHATRRQEKRDGGYCSGFATCEQNGPWGFEEVIRMGTVIGLILGAFIGSFITCLIMSLFMVNRRNDE